MGKLAATALIAASFVSGWWAVDNINWDLFYPEAIQELRQPRMFRHVYNSDRTVRMLQEFDREGKTWKNVQVDWVQPQARPMDFNYLSLDHVPNDGQTGNGMPGTEGQNWKEGM